MTKDNHSNIQRRKVSRRDFIKLAAVTGLLAGCSSTEQAATTPTGLPMVTSPPTNTPEPTDTPLPTDTPIPTPTISSWPTPACAEDGVLEIDKVPSPTNVLDIYFQYYLPPCYEQSPETAYPVLYLIHGRGGNHLTWTRAAEIANRMIRDGAVPPFILVMPQHSMEDPYGVALVNDLIPQIDAKFRTLPDRRYRAVGGGSRGGVAAARMGFQFPEVFGSAGVFGGGLLPGDEENFNAWISATPSEQRPRVLIDIGDQDTMMTFTEALIVVLDEHEVPYTHNLEPGDHSYDYWSGNMEMYLQWYAEDW